MYSLEVGPVFLLGLEGEINEIKVAKLLCTLPSEMQVVF